MGYRGRFLLFLICGVTCTVVYFTYVLNSASDNKADTYDLNEAILERKDPGDAATEDFLKEPIVEDLVDVQPGQNLSHTIKSTFDQLTSAYSDLLAGRRGNRDFPKVPSIEKHQRPATGGLKSRILPTNSSLDGQESSRQETSRDLTNSVIYDNLKLKLLQVNDSTNKIEGSQVNEESDSPDMSYGTIRRIEENLITWKRKEESRLTEERKYLEEGKQRLLEEKLRFQQEMSHIMHEIRRGSFVDIQKKLASRPQRPVDPSNWEGLNYTLIGKRYSGFIFMEGYRLGQPFVAPDDASAAGMQGSPQSLSEMLDSQAEERFFQLISEIQMDCIVIQRMGSLADGGWDVCTVPPFDLKPGCIVYSFGINYDFTFDDAIATSFDCSVKAFDPSMSVGDHVRSARVQFYQLGLGAKNTVTNNGWKLNTFRQIRKKLGHVKSVIDILKMDIEFYEWECLRNMIDDNSLENVKQLMFEMHTPEVAMVQRPSTKEDFARMYGLLSDLEKAGFRRYNVHMNPLGQYTSSRTGKTRSCCFELYYINVRFLK